VSSEWRTVLKAVCLAAARLLELFNFLHLLIETNSMTKAYVGIL